MLELYNIRMIPWCLGLVQFVFFCHSISVTRYSSLITHHSSLITHHSKIPCLFGTITQYFSHYLWVPYLSPGAAFFFSLSLSSLQYPNSPNLVRKKKKKPRTNRTNEKKKKRTEQPTQEKKGKKSQKMVKSCGYVLFVGPLCVFNYNIVIEL